MTWTSLASFLRNTRQDPQILYWINKKRTPAPELSKDTAAPLFDFTTLALTGPRLASFVEREEPSTGTKWLHDVPLVVSQQTRHGDESFGNVLGPGHRAAKRFRIHRVGMLRDVSEVINVKTLVSLWGMYGGVLERAASDKMWKPHIWEEVFQGK